jgi:UDP-N-acetylglucosamine:LPS N-acetylglucosamine transferase
MHPSEALSSPPTVLFAYLRTGGGHLAPARALASCIEQHHRGKVRAVLVDGLEKAAPIARWILEDGYRILQARARWYYEFLYLTNKVPPVAWWNARLVSPIVREHLRDRIAREEPARIVIVHFLLIQPILEILREQGLHIPVTVLVTDPLTAHPLWFRNRDVDFVLFSEELRRHCIQLGIPDDRLAVFPFVLSEHFTGPPAPDVVAAMKRARGFTAGRSMVLVLGGADGIPRGARILRGLVRDVTGADIAIVCGKNERLFRDAVRIRDTCGRRDVTVYGFVDFASELINAADIVISKCGASTFMEILISGRIPVITNYLWEQEKGNKDLLERSRSGFYEPRLRRLPGLVNRLLRDTAMASTCRTHISDLRLRNGTPEVARWLVEDLLPITH